MTTVYTKETWAELKNDDCIMKFDGEYSFLSNFYECEIEVWGHKFRSVEAAFQALKCPERMDEFENLTAYEAKRLGRKVKLRDDWELRKISIMKMLLEQKFSHPELTQKLVATGNLYLIEGNYWKDDFWGVCEVGKGQNHLGKLLMEVRSVYLRRIHLKDALMDFFDIKGVCLWYKLTHRFEEMTEEDIDNIVEHVFNYQKD